MRFNSHRASRYLLFITLVQQRGTRDSNIGCQDNRLHSFENIPLNAEYFYSYLIRLGNERRTRRREKRERRELYTLAIRVHTRESKLSPFRAGGGRAAAAKWKGCAGRRGGSRGAPSYFTVITVTCYRVRSLRHAINRRLPLPYQRMEGGKG